MVSATKKERRADDPPENSRWMMQKTEAGKLEEIIDGNHGLLDYKNSFTEYSSHSMCFFNLCASH